MVPQSVLIVDDDPVIQLLLKVNFEMDGFDVTVAGDGEEGLAQARAKAPDLMLLDVMMPKLDGYGVLKALHEGPTPPPFPVVLLSAMSQDSDRQAGLDAGATAYITKPFDPLGLLKEVKQFIK